MTLLRQIPQQTLGASPVRYVVPGSGSRALDVEIVVVQSGTTAITLDIYDETGNDQPMTSTANGPVHIKSIACAWIDITGNGTTIVGGIFVANSDVNPDQYTIAGPVAISGTVSTDWGQGTGVLSPSALSQSGVTQPITEETIPVWLFGNGSDGAVVMDGSNTFAFATLVGSTYTLTRTVQATSLTVNAGIALSTGTGGYQIFSQGSVINMGTISGGGGGTGGVPGAGGGGNGNTGGNGSISLYGFQGGGGGGGGATGTQGGLGGTGGTGGGIVWICCVDLINLSSINCFGTTGGNAAGINSNNGGGGGGGGGCIYLGYARSGIGIGSSSAQTFGGSGGTGSTFPFSSTYNGGNGGASANAAGGNGGTPGGPTAPTAGSTGPLGAGGGGGGEVTASAGAAGAAGGAGQLIVQQLKGI
jgi:hypothetical protein